MYYVSTQGVDEHMINVHYYYYYNQHERKEGVTRLFSVTISKIITNTKGMEGSLGVRLFSVTISKIITNTKGMEGSLGIRLFSVTIRRI